MERYHANPHQPPLFNCFVAKHTDVNIMIACSHADRTARTRRSRAR